MNKAGGTAVLERPKVVVRAASGQRDVPDGPGAARRGRTGRPVRPDRHLPHRARLPDRVRRRPHRAALSVERAPWGNMYEFNITFSTVAVGVYLGAAGPEEERPLARPAPDHHGPARPRPRGHGPVHRQRPAGPGAALVLAVHPRLDRDLLRRGLLRRRGRHDPVPLQGLLREQAAERRHARHLRDLGPGAAARPPPPSTSSPTASTPPSSRCGRSRSSRAPSGPATPGAATGAGTPRRPGPSSPGSPTPATCTPAPPPAGRAARPPTWP